MRTGPTAASRWDTLPVLALRLPLRLLRPVTALFHQALADSARTPENPPRTRLCAALHAFRTASRARLVPIENSV